MVRVKEQREGAYGCKPNDIGSVDQECSSLLVRRRLVYICITVSFVVRKGLKLQFAIDICTNSLQNGRKIQNTAGPHFFVSTEKNKKVHFGSQQRRGR